MKKLILLFERLLYADSFSTQSPVIEWLVQVGSNRATVFGHIIYTIGCVCLISSLITTVNASDLRFYRCAPTYFTDTISACNSYTWIDGNTYTSSNDTATYTLTNASGCDSIVRLHLTISNTCVDSGNLIITEITDGDTADAYSYLEMMNLTRVEINLNTCKLIRSDSAGTSGVHVFDFATDGSGDTTIPVGGFFMVSRNVDQTAFESHYGALDSNVHFRNSTNYGAFHNEYYRWALRCGGTANTNDGTLIDDIEANKQHDRIYQYPLGNWVRTDAIYPLTPGGIVAADSSTVIADRGFNGAWRGGAVNGSTGTLRAVISTDTASISSSVINLGEVEVLPYATVAIDSFSSLIVNGNIINNGTINIQNSGSLLQTGATDANSGSGTYTIIRNSGELANNTRYNYWASPLSDESLEDAFPNSNTVDFYSLTNNVWNSALGIMQPGWGYTSSGDVGASYPTSFDRTFSGTNLNNGTINVTGLSGAYVLLGNPYPSGLHLNSFVMENTNVGALYFWDHNLQQNTSGNYATWTYGSGGVASSTGTTIPDGNIASCQGFMVEMLSGTSVVFENNHRTIDNDQFFSSSATRNRFWLSCTNNQGDDSQLLLAFDDEATDGHDRLYDGKKLSGNSSISFYSKLNGENYVIQGLSKPGIFNKIIPLEIEAEATGNYTIALDVIDNWPEEYSLQLIDKKEHRAVNLLETSTYDFVLADSGVIAQRFYIKVSNTQMVDDSTNENTQEPNSIFDDFNKIENVNIYTAQNKIWIDATNTNIEIESAELVAMTGQMIQKVRFTDGQFHSLSTEKCANGIYLITVNTNKGRIAKKVLVN